MRGQLPCLLPSIFLAMLPFLFLMQWHIFFVPLLAISCLQAECSAGFDASGAAAVPELPACPIIDAEPNTITATIAGTFIFVLLHFPPRNYIPGRRQKD